MNSFGFDYPIYATAWAYPSYVCNQTPRPVQVLCGGITTYEIRFIICDGDLLHVVCSGKLTSRALRLV